MRIRGILAYNVAHLRKEQGFTSQERLAEAASISRVALARIETAASYPDESTVSALARALNVPESRLFADPQAIPEPSPKQALKVLADAAGIEIPEEAIQKARMRRLEEISTSDQAVDLATIPPDVLEALKEIPKESAAWSAIRAVVQGTARARAKATGKQRTGS